MTYPQSGVNYADMDPVKKMAQEAGRYTAKNLISNGFSEIPDSRGESAYIWKQGNIHMASVVEGLGTKNLVADEMRKITGKTYYDIIGHDTVATIINDLISTGATPLVIHAYWAIANSSFLSDLERIKDLINGWKSACDLSGASWGGGETPTLKGIINPGTIDLGGSAVGIIKSKKRLIRDSNLKNGDRIILLGSSGVNANGISLTRAIADRLPQGYATKLPDGKLYGEVLLTKTNIYANLLEKLFSSHIQINYISNITGHGLKKLMRALPDFTYRVEKILPPQPVFSFIQNHSTLSDFEMYQTFNMGMDYALFIPEKHAPKSLSIIKEEGYEAIDAGYVSPGKKQIVIEPKNIVYLRDSLDLR